MIKLYTTGCPQCKVLETKLELKGVEVEKIEDRKYIIELGLRSVPVLQLEDGTFLFYKDAVNWVNGLEV